MAETRRKPPIVAQPRRKYWREHGTIGGYPLRPIAVHTGISLPSGDLRGKTFGPARMVELRLRDAAEMRAFRFLPGTKIARTHGRYAEAMVSIPLIIAEVEGRLWRSRRPLRRYPARPFREVRHG